MAAGIPGAVVHEAPKLWKVLKAHRQRLDVTDLLGASVAFRVALVNLHTAMTAAARTGRQKTYFSPLNAIPRT